MKRILLLLVSCLVILGAWAVPAQARVMDDAVQIVVNGKPYFGEWAFVGDRPYVCIEAFGQALGYPRNHHVLGWCLDPAKTCTANCPTSPFDLAVRSKGKVLRTVRSGGNTMVDLRQALEVLEIPFHYRFRDRVFEVGNPYNGGTMAGACYRWMSLHYDYYDFKGNFGQLSL